MTNRLSQCLTENLWQSMDFVAVEDLSAIANHVSPATAHLIVKSGK